MVVSLAGGDGLLLLKEMQPARAERQQQDNQGHAHFWLPPGRYLRPIAEAYRPRNLKSSS